MPERRMFAKSIMRSDSYLDMPCEVQSLYVQLCMEADDDGFVDNPRAVMRYCGASNDSMKLLIAKKFVLTFGKEDNFLALIKGWKVHNYIAKDRYHESKYKEYLKSVYYDANGSYTQDPESAVKPCLYTDCTQDVYKLETQVRLGKDSIGKVIDRLDRKKEEKEERTSFSLSFTDDDFDGLDIPEPTKEDLRFLRESSRDLYKAGLDKYRWRAQG